MEKNLPELRTEVAALSGRVDFLESEISRVRDYINTNRKFTDSQLREIANNLKHFMKQHKVSWIKRVFLNAKER